MHIKNAVAHLTVLIMAEIATDLYFLVTLGLVIATLTIIFIES